MRMTRTGIIGECECGCGACCGCGCVDLIVTVSDLYIEGVLVSTGSDSKIYAPYFGNYPEGDPHCEYVLSPTETFTIPVDVTFFGTHYDEWYCYFQGVLCEGLGELPPPQEDGWHIDANNGFSGIGAPAWQSFPETVSEYIAQTCSPFLTSFWIDLSSYYGAGAKVKVSISCGDA